MRKSFKIASIVTALGLLLAVGVMQFDFSQKLQTSLGNFGGGDGSLATPWLVEDCQDLQAIGSGGSFLLSHSYKLTASGDQGGGDIWTDSLGFEPIGRWRPLPAIIFTGSFDGDGYTVSDLFINRPNMDGVGLFGYVGTGAGDISNVRLIDVDITGGYAVGGLIGLYFSTSPAVVSDAFVTGSVTGTDVFTDRGYVGGLIGRLLSSSSVIINNSSFSGNVTGVNTVGGLVGEDNNSSISNSYSVGSVSSTDNLGNRIGGLIGLGGAGVISNSYSSSNVSGNDRIGGLIGDGGVISNSYSVGSVSGTGPNVGGLVGFGAACTNSFWDNDASGQVTSACGATGKPAPGMTTQSTFTDASWDFTTIWKIVAGPPDSYPCLQWQDNSTCAYPSGGLFSYNITSCEQLQKMNLDLNGNYTLAKQLQVIKAEVIFGLIV